MKASEVLKRYAAGERDFRRVNLRGQSFKGEDLTGADFSSADIRGADFTNANLLGADFRQAQAGLQPNFASLLVLISLTLAGVSGFTSAFVGAFAEFLFLPATIAKYTILPGVILLTTLFILCVAIVRRGFGVTLGAVAIAAVVTVVARFAIGALIWTENLVTTSTLSTFLSVLGSLALANTLIVILAITESIIWATLSKTSVIARVGVVILAVAGVVAALGVAKVGTLAATIAITLVLVGGYFGWQVSTNVDKNFSLIRNVALACAAIGGTSFKGANLTDVNFTQAILKNTDFRKSLLARTCFRHV